MSTDVNRTGMYCGNSPPTPPGNSTACAVTFEQNNTAIFRECCGTAPIGEYSFFNGPGPSYCYQYCNISAPFFNESDTYKCLWPRGKVTNYSTHITGTSCRDGFELSGAQSRMSDKALLIGIVLLMGGLLLNLEV